MRKIYLPLSFGLLAIIAIFWVIKNAEYSKHNGRIFDALMCKMQLGEYTNIHQKSSICSSNSEKNMGFGCATSLSIGIGDYYCKK